VREVERESGVPDCSLEIAEALWGVEGGDGDRDRFAQFWKKRILKVYLVYILVSLSWQQITGVRHATSETEN